jgi:cytochrome oxidase assembly protein ShyY1
MRWLALIVFVIVLGVAFVNLGQWQLRRLDERQVENQVIRANEKGPIAEFGSTFSGPISEQDEWQRVRVTGTFDTAHNYVIRYRDNGDGKGYEAVTPLKTDGGESVLINRGFVPVAGGQQIPDTVPAPPSGQVSVIGRVRANETGRDNATVPVNGQARLINSDKISDALGYPVVDGYIDVLSMEPVDTVEFEPIALPELNDGPHFWYAVQWFMFTGIGVLGVIVFIRGDLRERRERKAAAAKPTTGTTTADTTTNT